MPEEFTPPPGIWGIAATFDGPEALRDAAQAAQRAGYRRMSAYSPFPVEGLAEAVGFRFNWLPPLVALAGFAGAGGGYFMMWYACVIAYPLNVGGRPLHSWPSFIPITFELGVLAASLTSITLLVVLCGLPRPHHPIFGAPNFSRLGRGRFILCIESRDPVFSPERTRHFLESLGAAEVSDVPNA